MLLLERVQQSLHSNNNNFRVTLHHFASNGDVEAVQSLISTHPEINIDIHSPRSRTTALHSALIQNQQGFIINYLISKGADVNAFNTKGFSPMILAIKHCRNGTLALETLIESGGSLERFEKGRFVGLTLLDLARQWKNEDAVKILKKHGCVEGSTSAISTTEGNDGKNGTMNNSNILPENELYCQAVIPEKSISPKKKTNSANSRKAMCPCCNCWVKFPTRMSFLTFNQEQAEKEYYQILKNQLKTEHVEAPLPNTSETLDAPLSSSKKISVKTSKGSEIYISRKYLDQFMTHDFGQSYKKLCTIEYHGVGNMHKLRKEISESYSMLHAVQESWMALKGITNNERKSTSNSNDEINFNNVFLVDLCSGKSMTTALCAVLFPKENKNQVLAVDKLPAHMVPHYFHEGNITYLSRDIMTDIFYGELEEAIKRQTEVEKRTVMLVGMHLCGNLSERAIEFFNTIKDIRAIILSPCCLPKLRERKDTFTTSKKLEDEKYMDWSNHLKSRIEIGISDDLNQIASYNDDEMHSTKNSIITATRNSTQLIAT